MLLKTLRHLTQADASSLKAVLLGTLAGLVVYVLAYFVSPIGLVLVSGLAVPGLYVVIRRSNKKPNNAVSTPSNLVVGFTTASRDVRRVRFELRMRTQIHSLMLANELLRGTSPSPEQRELLELQHSAAQASERLLEEYANEVQHGTQSVDHRSQQRLMRLWFEDVLGPLRLQAHKANVQLVAENSLHAKTLSEIDLHQMASAVSCVASSTIGATESGGKVALTCRMSGLDLEVAIFGTAFCVSASRSGSGTESGGASHQNTVNNQLQHLFTSKVIDVPGVIIGSQTDQTHGVGVVIRVPKVLGATLL